VSNFVSTTNEEHRLRVFKNRVQRQILEPKSEEVTGGCRKLHYTELIYTPLQLLFGKSNQGG
jgi:hypothetical protein